MAGWREEGLCALKRIIARAEAQRVDTMLQIAVLDADEVSSAQARADLVAVEKLLKTMRRQHSLLVASVYSAEAARPEDERHRTAA